MIRFLAILAAAVALGALLGDSLVQAASWTLAFLSLLMLGDLLWSQGSKLLRRSRRA